MRQAAFLAIIAGVMIFSGFLGGLVNYFVSRKEDPQGSSFLKSVILGVAASFLVPLFLNMISSSLLESIRTGGAAISNIAVFLGFCLVAAISSTAFIKTLSDRILQEAKEAKKEAREAKKEARETQSVIQPLVEKVTEEGEEDVTNTITATIPAVIAEDQERNLLSSLSSGRWVLRTRTGLAKETGIPKPEVITILDNLRKRGLVDYKFLVGRPGEKKQRWYITNEGRAAIAPK